MAAAIWSSVKIPPHFENSRFPDWRISTVSTIYIQYVRTVLKSFSGS
ncbi:Uncharacterised protein [Enterocloster clostridioformis]|uniref:Uncharacterized protein n=1 Tax=Enterocloster clostridioformis TaxID=1531 RepID=A0A174UY90_9FIRM|nr:Uncharacterised protein [Enterocloster clostridioformis]